MAFLGADCAITLDAIRQLNLSAYGIIKELEEQIAREEAAMTEEEKTADELWQKEFCKRMIKLVKEKYPC